MYRQLIYNKTCNANDIVDHFKLTFLLKNPRTSIYENDDMRLSVDKAVYRIFLYDDSNKELLKKLNNYFYGE